jgi:hypothetical protein
MINYEKSRQEPLARRVFEWSVTGFGVWLNHAKTNYTSNEPTGKGKFVISAWAIR